MGTFWLWLKIFTSILSVFLFRSSKLPIDFPQAIQGVGVQRSVLKIVGGIEQTKSSFPLLQNCSQVRQITIKGNNTHYRFEIRRNSVKSTVRSEIDHFRCKIGSEW